MNQNHTYIDKHNTNTNIARNQAKVHHTWHGWTNPFNISSILSQSVELREYKTIVFGYKLYL